jgi:glycosyltransferase involved in cell wall biosynthesis
MIIAVNTRLLLKNRLEGIGWFMYENLRRITPAHPEHTFLFLFDRPYDKDFIFSQNIRPLVIPPPTRHPVLWYTWFEFMLPGVLKKHKADVYFGPDGFMPLKLDIPSLVTIHDINFHHRPMDLTFSNRIYYRKFFPRFAHKAERITTVSEYSKSDLVNSYGVDREKIDVVYNGANELFSPLSPEEIIQTRKSLTGGTPYFVFVGAMHPRKNLTNLLLGFDLFRSDYGHPFKMVLVGEKMFMTKDIDRTYGNLGHREDVVFTGRLTPEKLRMVLGGSGGLSYVPFFEGFGIPLIEAMRCEVPILASNVTSLPEIAGEAALYADPREVSEIADGMLKLATDEALKAKLIQKGRIRSREFSWDRSAELLWNSLLHIIDSC